MPTQKTTEYQAWFQAEMEFAKGVRKRKRAVFLKCIAITFVVAVLAGAAGFVLNVGSDSDTGMFAVIGAVFSFFLVALILLICMLPGFLKGRYGRKIKRAVKRQGFTDDQRERFAGEQMAALGDSACTASFIMTGFGEDHMPARFTLSDHYACLTGGTGFGPYIIRLEGTETVRVSSSSMNIPAITRVFTLSLSRNQNYTSYLVRFVGNGREQGCIKVYDAEGYGIVMDILRRRFPVMQ